MYYKTDWEQAKKRLTAFWNHDVIDRCCVIVHAPRNKSKKPPFPELQWGPWLEDLEKYDDYDTESIIKWWTDPEKNYQRMITWFENNYFGGEAVPATYINWGASAGAAFWGSPPKFSKTTVWYPSVIKDWDTWNWDPNPELNFYWKNILDIQQKFIDECHGRYFIGVPEIGDAADLLSLMRGMDNLALDLFDHPEEVKKAVEIMSDLWVKLHEDIYQKTVKINQNGGVLPWMNLWAPGRHDQLANDFSSILSTNMFKEFFESEIIKMGKWCDYATYHLDGKNCILNHLDYLLSIKEIDNIEFTPGIGQPPTYYPEYIPLYKKIQASGKNLYLLTKPNEIEPILTELSPKGLLLSTNLDSEDDANQLLKKVSKWSARNNTFPSVKD